MRSGRRVIKVVLLVLCTLVVANECILRHSYHRRITNRSPGESIFYSDWVIDANRWRVRSWIRRDFTCFEYLGYDVPPSARQMLLLSRFHQKADLELLWYRAEKGFPIQRGMEEEEDLLLKQYTLCNFLRERMEGFYDTSTEEGLVRLREELQRRKIAPEVRAAFERYEERLGVSLFPHEQGRKKEPTPMAHP